MRQSPTTPGSRRALFARFRGGPEQVRPPWSRPDFDFTEACTVCGRCIDVCPTGLLTKGHAGYPIADFSRGECSFCGACADACDAPCFRSREEAPWTLKAAIGPHCVETKGVVCRACEEACPQAAIRFRPQRGGASVSVDAVACTGCGACVKPCPVRAISISPAVIEGLST